MNQEQIRESGLLELYLHGSLEDSEQIIVIQALEKYPQLQHALKEIEFALLKHAENHAVKPHGAVKPMLLATFDYLERLKNGETPSSPPILHEQSTLADYSEWLEREDMVTPPEMESMYARLIAHESDKLTAIVWLRFGAPDETHTNEYEKFLIVEGTCTITIGSEEHHLTAGAYLSIPLYINHNVSVTSSIPCKIILQRIAA